jgi:RNA polymerase sigma factor (sigma-70 family)
MRRNCTFAGTGINLKTRRSHVKVAEEVAGDRLSFETFFLTTQRDLLGAPWLITRDRHESEEVAQEAFARLWERWDRVSRIEDPTAYLYRTAMNVWRSRLRRTKVAIRRAVHLKERDDGLATVELRDALVRALASATPRERAALVLTALLDMTSEEAGAALGVRASTVRVLAGRARARAAEGMEP